MSTYDDRKTEDRDIATDYDAAPVDAAPVDGDTVHDNTVGDNVMNDRTLGDRAAGDRTLDDDALDDETLDDETLDDDALDDDALDNGLTGDATLDGGTLDGGTLNDSTLDDSSLNGSVTGEGTVAGNSAVGAQTSSPAQQSYSNQVPAAPSYQDSPGRDRAGDTSFTPGAVAPRTGATDENLLGDTTELVTQWQHAQAEFLDDPQSAITTAADVVAEAASRLEAGLRARRGSWDSDGKPDTETLRQGMLEYRRLFDMLVS